MREIHVTPKSGLVVVDPATNEDLPDEGKTVTKSAYWTRMKNDGAVIIKAASKVAAKSKTKSEG